MSCPAWIITLWSMGLTQPRPCVTFSGCCIIIMIQHTRVAVEVVSWNPCRIALSECIMRGQRGHSSGERREERVGRGGEGASFMSQPHGVATSYRYSYYSEEKEKEKEEEEESSVRSAASRFFFFLPFFLSSFLYFFLYFFSFFLSTLSLRFAQAGSLPPPSPRPFFPPGWGFQIRFRECTREWLL